MIKKKNHTSFQRWILESIKPYLISDPNVRLKPICPITDQKGIENYSSGYVDSYNEAPLAPVAAAKTSPFKVS